MLDTTLINSLQNKEIYDHPVTEFQMIETHASWVILTGDYVYKIKKPVDFDFLNYSTLAKRKHFCEEELRLNQALAPQVYLSVVPIYGSAEAPSFTANGTPIEYAVKMREFSQACLFDRLLAADALTNAHIIDMATQLAQFHLQTTAAKPDAYYGTAKQMAEPVQQNFDQIRELLKETSDIEQLDKLEAFVTKDLQRLAPVIDARHATGLVKECHGDIHLGNIALIDDKAVLFDCIEFNEEFRWTDTMADLGFLLMDLDDKQSFEYSQLTLSTYMSITGDYDGLNVLRFYQNYRAVVRAKIAIFALYSQDVDDTKHQAIMNKYREQIQLAMSYCQHERPQLILTYGTTGSGKSTVAKALQPAIPALHIRSDIERKRLHNLQPADDGSEPVNAGMYDLSITERVYAHLLQLAKLSLTAGYSVIIDGTFLKQAYRAPFLKLAHDLGRCCTLLHCHAPAEILRQRVANHSANSDNPSDSYLDVLEMQLNDIEPLSDNEQSLSISIDTSQTLNQQAVLKQIRENTCQTDLA